MTPAYRAQVELLLRILPHISSEPNFALKGGTAINLFVYDMPRLSVDIDLIYLPFNDRKAALDEISQSLSRLSTRLNSVSGVSASTPKQAAELESKLICSTKTATVKIEVNTVIRGNLLPVRAMPLVQKAQDAFSMFAEMPVISQGELFGGKICAALDRQHPRDLFDIHQLLRHGGIAEEIKKGFIASLLSHSRPIHEMLDPRFQDQRLIFETQFAGMTNEPFSYEEFDDTRQSLVREIRRQLTPVDHELLLSFLTGEPRWELFSIATLQDFPAVRWKLTHVRELKTKDSAKHAKQIERLEALLSE